MVHRQSTHRQSEKKVDNVTVTAGTSNQEVYKREVDKEEINNVIAYTSAGSGSISLDVEYSYGTDASGNDVWFTALSSTGTSDETTITKPVRKVRVLVSETGGTSDITVTVWHSSLAGT